MTDYQINNKIKLQTNKFEEVNILKAITNTRLLKSHRIKWGMSQYNISKILGRSPKAYNHKENAKANFDVNEIITIANELKLTLDEVNDIFFDGKLTKGTN